MSQSVGDPKHRFVYDLINSSDPNRKLQVLIADGTVSDNVPNFTGVMGITTHQSTHLGSNNQPLGGNVCYTDGHVEWVDFASGKVKRRYHPGTGTSPNLYFWW